MAKPILYITDDEPVVLNLLEKDLKRRYKTKYRVMKLLMKEGLEVHELLHELRDKKSTVALFIADQRMPNVSGIDFLLEAKEVFPLSKRCLLTTFDDITDAVSSINDVGLDYYFLKPWNPAKEKLFPILDDLLEAWKSENLSVTFEGIRVVGTKWSRSTHQIKDFLAHNQIPFLFQDLETNIGLKIQLEKIDPFFRIPVVLFPEGDHLMAPSIQQLAEKIGLQTKASQPFYDLIIVGAGPAGLAAAVYGASEGLKTLLIDKEATGGQAGTSSKIENYLGFPTGISGAELAQKATIQAKRLGAEILLPHEVVQVKVKDPTNILKVVELKDGTELACFSLIIATGVSVNRFKLPGVDRLLGSGVFYGAALTEIQDYKNKEVIVLGGGNSAGQGAMFFSLHASKVRIIIRRDSLDETMSQYLIDQINDTENIELVPNTIITEIKGDKILESVTLENIITKEKQDLCSSALFIFIGARPFTRMVDKLVQRDEGGYILTGFDLGPKEKIKGWSLERDPMTFETNIPGIFACGDVRFGSSKRVAAAVGEGSIAVRLIHEYLKTV